MMYLGKMNFKQFAQMAQAFGAPIIERTEVIGDNQVLFNYCYLADTGNQVYYKCDNIYVWMYSPQRREVLDDNDKRALEEAKKFLNKRHYDNPTL